MKNIKSAEIETLGQGRQVLGGTFDRTVRKVSTTAEARRNFFQAMETPKAKSPR